MIEFSHVRRSYGKKVAVQDLSLAIPPGEVFGLLGHNGAGKTTTIKMLVGLLRPDSGSVRVGEFDLIESTRQATSMIGYVPDQPYLYDKLSGREFLSFVAEMHGMDRQYRDRRIEEEVARFELDTFVDDLCESYSHGMKQRTVFASAMIHDPKVLVVDEPLVGLDPHSIRLVKNLLREQTARGVSVLMSTHTLGVAEEVADRLGIMSQGKLIFLGTIEQLRSLQSDQKNGSEENAMPQRSLEDLYLELVGTAHSPAPGNFDPEGA